jgi:hypothetical protein
MERHVEIISLLYQQIRAIILNECYGCAHRSTVQIDHLCLNYSDESFLQIKREALFLLRVQNLISAEELRMFTQTLYSNSDNSSFNSDFSELDQSLSD